MDIWKTGLLETNLPEMTFSGAVLIIVIVIARMVFLNRLPKNTFLVLWGIVLLRLLLPVSIPSGFSVYSFMLEGNSYPQTASGWEQEPTEETDGSVSSVAGWEQEPTAQEKKQKYLFGENRYTSILLQWLHDLAALSSSISSIVWYAYDRWRTVWAAGCIAVLCIFAALYVKCRRKFAESLPVENEFAEWWIRQHKIRRPIQIRQSDRIQAPLTYGFLRPVILMPKHTDWENERQLAYIFTHEYIHIRRFDIITKILLAAAVSVHWFNPFVWFMYVLCNRDLELSCDEIVLRLAGHGSKAEYAHILISMEERKSVHAPLCSSFSKYAVEERITAIMKNKKVTLMTGMLAASLVAGISFTFATSAAASDRVDTARTISGNAVEINDAEDGEAHVTEEPYLISQDEKFKDYEKYGLSYDKKSGYLIYKGKKVGYFKDEWSYQTYTRYIDQTGEIGVIVMRDKDYKITGLQEADIPFIIEDESSIIEQGTDAQQFVAGAVYYDDSQSEDFSKGAIQYDAVNSEVTETGTATETGEGSGIPMEYDKYGISSDGKAQWIYKGRKVAGLYDQGCYLYTTDFAPKDSAVYLEVQRDENGRISGMKEITKKEMQKLVDDNMQFGGL